MSRIYITLGAMGVSGVLAYFLFPKDEEKINEKTASEFASGFFISYELTYIIFKLTHNVLSFILL